MASPKQTAAGTWRIQIEVRGQRDANTLPTKRQALEWAAQRKSELLALGSGRAGEIKTVADALERYGREVSVNKRGELKETIRLKAFLKHPSFPGRVLLADLRPHHLVDWRDARLQVNARGSVLRDMTLLSHVLETARRGRDAMHDLGQEPGGRVTVGMPPRVAMGLSVPLVRSFRARFPRAVITVLEGLSLSLRESLVAGRLDLALLFDPQPSPQLAYETLMREQLLLVAPPGSRLPARVPLAALSSYPLVLPNARTRNGVGQTVKHVDQLFHVGHVQAHGGLVEHVEGVLLGGQRAARAAGRFAGPMVEQQLLEVFPFGDGFDLALGQGDVAAWEIGGQQMTAGC